MSNIKKYQDWLLEKHEAEVFTSMGKVSDKSTEKEHSKSLSNNYEINKISKGEATSKHSEPVKPSKPKAGKSTSKEEAEVQTSNKKVKASEPVKKGTHQVEKEEQAKKPVVKTPKTPKAPVAKEEEEAPVKTVGDVKKTEISKPIKKSKTVIAVKKEGEK
jgi:hypothetical protein